MFDDHATKVEILLAVTLDRVFPDFSCRSVVADTCADLHGARGELGKHLYPDSNRNLRAEVSFRADLPTPWHIKPESRMPHSQGFSNNPCPELNQPNYSLTPISLRTILILSHNLRLSLPKDISCRFTC